MPHSCHLPDVSQTQWRKRATANKRAVTGRNRLQVGKKSSRRFSNSNWKRVSITDPMWKILTWDISTSIRYLVHSYCQWNLLYKLFYGLLSDVIPGGTGLPFFDELVKNPVQLVGPLSLFIESSPRLRIHIDFWPAHQKMATQFHQGWRSLKTVCIHHIVGQKVKRGFDGVPPWYAMKTTLENSWR